MRGVACRVGYRIGERGRSILFPRGADTCMVLTMEKKEEIIEWFRAQENVVDDNCTIAYFYRCMEEGTEFYYIYEEDGWRCGGVTGDTPLRGQLVSKEEAREIMEAWTEDLKYVV